MAVAGQGGRDRQEADGSWGGIQPPWVWSILMLAALGRDFDDPCLRRAVEGWGGFLVEEAERLRPETLAYLGFGRPADTVTALLSQAGAQAPGIAEGFVPGFSGTESVLLAVGIIGCWLYVRHARTVTAPLLALSLLKIETFCASVHGACMFLGAC